MDQPEKLVWISHLHTKHTVSVYSTYQDLLLKLKNILTGIYPLVTKEISPKDLMVFYAYI